MKTKRSHHSPTHYLSRRASQSTSRRGQQLEMFGRFPTEHGGSLGAGKRKQKRPFNPKKSVHLVMRSERARGAWSMLAPRHQTWIRRRANALARRWDVKIYRYANSGNHLHLLLKARTREGFQSFLRAFSALVARKVTGAKKGNPVGKFWDGLAYTKIVEWGRHFFHTKFYVIINEIESAGLWTRRRWEQHTQQAQRTQQAALTPLAGGGDSDDVPSDA